MRCRQGKRLAVSSSNTMGGQTSVFEQKEGKKNKLIRPKIETIGIKRNVSGDNRSLAFGFEIDRKGEANDHAGSL